MDKLEKEANKEFNLWIEHLKSERQKKGIKPQSKLAELLNLDPGHMNKIENGKAQPTVKTLFKYLIINGFDLSRLYKVKIQSNESRSETDKKELINIIKELDNDSLAVVAEMTDLIKTFSIK